MVFQYGLPFVDYQLQITTSFCCSSLLCSSWRDLSERLSSSFSNTTHSSCFFAAYKDKKTSSKSQNQGRNPVLIFFFSRSSSALPSVRQRKCSMPSHFFSSRLYTFFFSFINVGVPLSRAATIHRFIG